MCFLRCMEADIEAAVTPEHWTQPPAVATTTTTSSSPVLVASGGGPGCLDTFGSTSSAVPPLDLSSLDVGNSDTSSSSSSSHTTSCDTSTSSSCSPPNVEGMVSARANLVATMASAVDQSYSQDTASPATGDAAVLNLPSDKPDGSSDSMSPTSTPRQGDISDGGEDGGGGEELITSTTPATVEEGVTSDSSGGGGGGGGGVIDKGQTQPVGKEPNSSVAMEQATPTTTQSGETSGDVSVEDGEPLKETTPTSNSSDTTPTPTTSTTTSSATTATPTTPTTTSSATTATPTTTSSASSTTTATPTTPNNTTTSADVTPPTTEIDVLTTNIHAPHKRFSKTVYVAECDIQFPMLTMVSGFIIILSLYYIYYLYINWLFMQTISNISSQNMIINEKCTIPLL